MGCKCGAMVKAGRDPLQCERSAGSDKGPFADPRCGAYFIPIGRFSRTGPAGSISRKQNLLRASIQGGARPGIAGLPAGQARGTMVARSNGNAGKVVTGEVRSPPRSKSIRRSKALERIKGNLSNTLSRILR
jgi:hypothetical protein